MKMIGWIVGIVLVAIAAGIGYLVFNSGSLIKSGVEQIGPDYLGADVKVGNVKLELTDGFAQIQNLQIGNPAGYEGPYAMKLNEVRVTLDIANTNNDLVVIKKMVIDGASIAAIAKGQRTNFQQLMDNVDKAMDSSDSSTTSSTNETKFIVDQFVFTNAQVSMNSDLLGAMNLPIPDIRLNNIGRSSNGITAAGLTQEIMQPITQALAQAAVKQGLDIEGVKTRAVEKIRNKLKSKLKLKSLTERLKQ
ncbi:MAG: hypothetical protein GXP16_14605 [Gammaproteobacteria bacterium]|nr:hypothetical protein [Gammaproteobacteria bacterium]